jgi:transcriptional regulator with XRE-family HTH domain
VEIRYGMCYRVPAMEIDTAKIERLRKKLKLSQAAAAVKGGLGGGKQQWGDIVKGRTGGVRGVSMRTVEKVAVALGVKAKDLLK